MLVLCSEGREAKITELEASVESVRAELEWMEVYMDGLEWNNAEPLNNSSVSWPLQD